MTVNWKELWDANPNIFVMSGWEECPEERQKAWHLPSQYSYFSSGDMNLRVGIIACRRAYKDEEFILAGILWASRLGNGARTVIYFVAQDFSPVFLCTLAKLGGGLSAKAVYWREKLTPSLFPVLEKDYARSSYRAEPGELRPHIGFWEKNLNPVAWGHLEIVRGYLKNFAKRRVREVFENNRIVYRWGNIEIVEIKKKSNKFEMTTKVKWTRNKNIIAKFQKSGWVDLAGNINDDFGRAVTGIIEFLENMEINNTLDIKDLLYLKMTNDREVIPGFFGKYQLHPWLNKHAVINPDTVFFYIDNSETRVVYAVLEKPVPVMVHSLLAYTLFEFSGIGENGLPQNSEAKWDKRIYMLSDMCYKEELRLCQSWLKQPANFPVILLPENWRTDGFKGLNSFDCSDRGADNYY